MTCSVTTEPIKESSINNMSRFSIVSTGTNDEVSVTSLGSVKAGANQSLTGGKQVNRIYSKFPHYIPLACLAFVMNPFLGLPALLCAIQSRHFQRTGQEGRAPKYSRWAFWLSLGAIASSIVTTIVIVLYLVVFTPNIVTNIPGLLDDNNPLFRANYTVNADYDANTTLSHFH